MTSNHIQGQLCLTGVETNAAKKMQKSYTCMLKERLEEYGVDNLLDEEILSLLTGISVDVLRKAIKDFGLPEFIKYSSSMNITKTQKMKLDMLSCLYRKMSTAKHKEKPALSSSSKAGEYALSLFIGKSYECFYVICLDAQNRVNYPALVQEGTINEAPVYPRLIIETALKYKANSIILCHNHPGGSLAPSQADIDVTRRIKQATDAISIKTVDHIIVAEDRYTSFAEKGLL